MHLPCFTLLISSTTALKEADAHLADHISEQLIVADNPSSPDQPHALPVPAIFLITGQLILERSYGRTGRNAPLLSPISVAQRRGHCNAQHFFRLLLCCPSTQSRQ